MPSSVAVRKCPQAIFLPPRIEYYRQESNKVFAIVERFSPVVERASIDEAYFDLTPLFPGAEQLDEILPAAENIVRRIKERIRAEAGITVSVGIAANKFLAKLASDWQKPDGLTVIPEASKVELLRPLPVRTIFGVGEVTEGHLKQAGLHTIADIQDYKGDLRRVVGSWAGTLKNFAFGIDDRELDTSPETKSISTEETFDADTADRKLLKRYLTDAAEEIAGHLADQKLVAQTVQVRVRYGDFTTLTRQMTLSEPTADARELYRLACFLLGKHKLVSRPLRLLGLGVSKLSPKTAGQLKLSF